MKNLKAIIIGLILPFLMVGYALGATYTVCSSGCDETTIQAVFDNNDLAGDDVVEVRADSPGGTATFREQVTWGANDEGTSDHPVTLQGRNGDTIIIEGADAATTWEQATGSNIIINGTMEADANWANYGTPDVNTRSAVQKHGGTYSRHFHTDAAFEGIRSDAYIGSTVTGATYNVSLWVYPDDNTQVRVTATKGDGTGTPYNINHSGLNQDAWNNIAFSYEETLGGSSAYMRATCSSGDIGNNIYVDDVIVKREFLNLYSKTFALTPCLALEDGSRLTEIAWDTDIATTYPSMSAGTYTIDTANKIVYMWCTDNADPDTHTIEVAARGSSGWGIKIADKSYITIDGFTIQNTTHAGVKVSASAGVDVSNIIIQNCIFTNNGTCGVNIENDGNKDAAHPITNITVDSNTVSYQKKHGIIFSYDVSESTVSRNTVHHASQHASLGYHGISSWSDDADSYPNNNIIEYNLVYSTNRAGATEGTGIQIDTGGNGSTCADYIIRYNISHDNSGPGFRAYSTSNADSNNVFHNNISYSNGEEGISVLYTQGTDIYNNTCYDNGEAGIRLEGNQTQDTNIKNNIFAENTSTEVQVDINANDGAVIDYNLVYHSAGGTFMDWIGTGYSWADWLTNSLQDANSVNSDPLFTNPASDDFTFQAGSPARSGGVAIAGYNDRIVPGSSWPDNVSTMTFPGSIGAYGFLDIRTPFTGFGFF